MGGIAGEPTGVPASGTIFDGRYEVLEPLGEGSFGQVFKARQISTGQLVAIKILRPMDATASSDNRVARFRREMRLGGALSHPNIVRLVDSGETESGALYAVFEFVPGATLRDVLAAEGKLSMAESAHLMAQVLDAISCAHAEGVVHRDLKPENIMITKTGARRNAMVLDFGLGGFATEAAGWAQPRLTATREIMGTPCYAAPEQLRGEPPTTRSDLYSWGLILLECLTGEMQVHGASAQEVVLRQLGPDPVPIAPSLRATSIGRALSTVTAKQAERRNITVESLLQVLLGSVGPPAAGEDVGQRERRQVTVVCCRFLIVPLDGKPLDIEEVDQQLRAQREVVSRHAESSGGLVVNAFADRILIAFGYPQAREDDVRSAARMALKVVAEFADDHAPRARVDVRVGVHTGVVVVREQHGLGVPVLQDLTGLVPQIASQIVDMAPSSGVLVSGDAMRLLRNDMTAEPAGELLVPELSDRVPLFRLLPGAGRGSVDQDVGAPLVGRTAQLEQLRAGWADARERRGPIVALSGEAGIGKSRLLRELRRSLPAEAWLECRCAPEDQNTTLRPVVELLLSLDEPLESLLSRHDLDLAEHLPLFTALLGQPPDPRFPPRALTPERQKDLSLQAIVSLLFRVAEDRPTALALENLHWADPTTLELVGLLIQALCAGRHLEAEPGPALLLLLTTRPEFVPPWSSEDITLMPLQRLSKEEVVEMVRGERKEEDLPPAVVDQIVRRAEGVPLFVEEIARLLLEPRDPSIERQAGRLVIPTSLRGLLTARLDKVSTAARDTAQMAAVLGREFRYDLLRAVSAKEEATLRDDLNELGRAGLLYQSRGLRREGYVFRHALLRDAAYESMMRPAREGLHRRVGQVLREDFKDIGKQRPELVAQHLEAGGETETAVDYWGRAGSRSFARAGYAEARAQLEHALALLEKLPESPKRLGREVELLVTLGSLLMSTLGWASHEVERVFSRAMSVCRRIGGDVPPNVLYGLWSVQITRSDPEGVEVLLPHMQTLAGRTEQPLLAHMGHACVGVAAFWQGNFAVAHDHFEQARRYVQGSHRYAYDGRLYSYAWDFWALWVLGHADQADRLCTEAFAVAAQSGDPYSHAIALAYGGMLALDCGANDRAHAYAAKLTTLAEEQHMLYWAATAACALGLSLVRRGEVEEGTRTIEHGVALCRRTGVMSSYNYNHTYLAEAYLAAGRIDEGLATVTESLALCRTLLARFHEAEILRLRGELLRLRGETEAAETSLREALALAERQGARGYGLRAAIALSRLLDDTHRRDEARAVLLPAYDGFDTVSATADARAAAELLARWA